MSFSFCIQTTSYLQPGPAVFGEMVGGQADNLHARMLSMFSATVDSAVHAAVFQQQALLRRSLLALPALGPAPLNSGGGHAAAECCLPPVG